MTKKSRWLLLAFLTMLALMIVLSLYFAPLYVFKTMHDYGLRGLSSFWSVGENSQAEAKFGYPLSAEVMAEFSTTLTGRKNTLYPFSYAATGDINIRVNDRYQHCHDYIIKDAELALPLKEAQLFNGEQCLYEVSLISSDRHGQYFSALLEDPRYLKPSRLLLMRRAGRDVRIIAQRETWIKQHFFTADGQLWYSRYEDKDSFAPDPCLLWKVVSPSDECVLWAHALNTLPAYENFIFYAGSTPGNVWLTIGGKKTNRLYAGEKVEAKNHGKNEWRFRDTGIRGIASAESLDKDLFYGQVQNPEDVPRSVKDPSSLWRISEDGSKEQILSLTKQSKRWTARNGVLQLSLQAMPGFPAKLMRWGHGGWKEMALTPAQKASTFVGFGNHPDMVSYYDAMAQRIIAMPDEHGWREQIMTKHPAGTRSQIIKAVSADGNLLDCLVLDRSLKKKPAATLVEIYGAYGNPNLPFPGEQTSALLQANVRLVYPQTRGGSGGGVKWAHAGRGAGKARIVEDAEACMQEVVRQGLAEPGKIISRGGSAGAIPAYWLLQRNPDMVAGAILERPYLAMQMQRGIINEVEFGSLAQQASRKVIDELNPYSSMLAGQLQHGKVLFLCGGEDINTPDWHCRASQTALRLRGHRQSWMYIAEHSDHHGLPPLHPETQTELRLLVNFVLKAGER